MISLIFVLITEQSLHKITYISYSLDNDRIAIVSRCNSFAGTGSTFGLNPLVLTDLNIS